MKQTMIFISTILLIALIYMEYALLVYFGWNWFLVNAFPQLETITFSTALTIFFARMLLLYKPSKLNKDSDIDKTKELGKNLFSPIVAIAIAYIVKLILF